jgi:HAE1 family hydrophobic/amphiphilic exporter-1
MIVLYVFLRRIGTTMVVSVAIPISIIATFNLMYFNHLTLKYNDFGRTRARGGRLVDDAIVVLENITRNRDEGMSIREAAIVGTGQVGGAITASTITTSCLPPDYLSQRIIR